MRGARRSCARPDEGCLDACDEPPGAQGQAFRSAWMNLGAFVKERGTVERNEIAFLGLGTRTFGFRDNLDARCHSAV